MTLSQKFMLMRWLHAPVLTVGFLLLGAFDTGFGTLTISWVIWWVDRGRVLIMKTLGKSRASGFSVKEAFSNLNAESLWTQTKDFGKLQYEAARIKRRMSKFIEADCTYMLDGEPVPWAKLRTILQTNHGYRLNLEIDSDKNFAVFEDRVGKLSREMNFAEVRVSLSRSGIVTVELLHTNPLAGVVSVLEADEPTHESIPVALDENGKQVRLGIIESNLLLGGIPGSGKSGGLSSILYGLSKLPHVALVGIDPKQVELAPWRPRFSQIVTELDEATTLLDSLASEMQRRYAWLVETGLKKVTADLLSDSMPLIVLVVDELAELTASGLTTAEKKEDVGRATLMRRLIAKGRAAGIVLIVATQKPASDVIPTGLRDLIAQRAAFATTTPDMTDTILGAGAGKDAPAHTIAPTEKGVAYIASEDSRQGVKARFFWLPDEDCTDHAELTSPLRVELSWLAPIKGNGF